MARYHSLTQLIGNTPLLEAARFCEAMQLKATVLVKPEYLNPTGSVKDRVAKAMIEQAEQAGTLKKGGTIIEPTSGNTGIGIAAVAAAKGYNAVIVMPDSMSVERRNLIRAYGARVVLTPGAKGMQGAIETAQVLKTQTPGAIIAGQFVNPANPLAHEHTTGPEIWQDTDGKVDILVAGVGTGGTLSGAGRYLKQQNPAVEVVAVEPASSPVLSKGTAGKHGIQGIGAGFVPETLDTDIYDAVMCVTEQQAFACAKMFAACEGMLVGISAGAALHAAAQLALQEKNSDKTIVVILPDSADRYYSTALFEQSDED